MLSGRSAEAAGFGMTRIKALLLGLGQIGCGYDLDQSFQPDQACSGAVTLTHARALACHHQVELVAAVDPSAQARERLCCVCLPGVC